MIRPQIRPSPKSLASSPANNPSPSSRTGHRPFSGVPVPLWAGLITAFPTRPRTWPSPRWSRAKALLEHLDLAPAAHRPGQALGHRHPDPRVDLRRLEEPPGLDGSCFPLICKGSCGRTQKTSGPVGGCSLRPGPCPARRPSPSGRPDW